MLEQQGGLGRSFILHCYFVFVVWCLSPRNNNGRKSKPANMLSLLLSFLVLSDCYLFNPHFISSDAAWISKVQSDCELEALNIGTRLSDRYNSLDEATEWDTRIHHDYLVKYLGFAGWIQIGLWKNTQLTAFRKHAPTLHKVSFQLLHHAFSSHCL